MNVNNADATTPMLADEEGGQTADRRYGPNNRSHDDEIRYAESTVPAGLSTSDAERRLDEYGLNQLEEKEASPCLDFLAYFWGPMPCMIWVAVLVELAKQDWLDFGVLMVLQVLNGVVGYFEEKNAGDAVAALKASLAPKCNVKRDGDFRIIDAKYLVPGDIVNIKLGDIVPADCKLLDGPPLEVDQSALTGESLPVTIYPQEQVKMGSTIKRGEIEAVVCFTGSNTFFGKAAEMVNSVTIVGRFQRILFAVTMFLLGLSTLLCTIILIVLISSHVGFLAAVGVVVVLLVASIPIAMQVVSTSTMAVGSRRLAEKKVIVARLSAIEELAGMNMLCSDKTGTLTQNKLKLYDPIVIAPNMNAADLLFMSALAAKRIAEGQDAIDYCICRAVEPHLAATFSQYVETDFIPFDPVIKRTEATLRCPDGSTLQVTKGAPQVVLGMCDNMLEVEGQVNTAVQQLSDRGYRSIGVGEKRDGRWMFLGLLSLFDPPRIDTAETLRSAMEMGIEVKMVTGDHTAIAKETCRSLGMGTNILNTDSLNDLGSRLDSIVREADGFAEVLPEHKFQIVEVLQRQDFVVGMTGDGVNDAPALKRAHIGIAVEGSTDAARAAADIVLTEPGLSVIVDAIIRSRKIFQRVRNYCIYRIACTVQMIFFFFVAVLSLAPRDYFCFESDARDISGSAFNCDFASLPPVGNCTTVDECVEMHNGDLDGSHYPFFYPGAKFRFTLPVLALVIITILNDGTIITIARDKVIPNKRPQAWRLNEVYVVAATLGFVPCVSSVLLLLAGLNCADGLNPWFASLLGEKVEYDGESFYHVRYEALLTIMYLKISISDFLTVFCARTRQPFYSRRPGYALLIAFCIATATSTIIATTADLPDDDYKMEHISWKVAAMVWVYNILWFLVQDFCKVMIYRVFDFFNATEDVDLVAKIAHQDISNMIEGEHHESRLHGNVHRSSNVVRANSNMGAAQTGMSAVLERLSMLEREAARVRSLEEEIASLRVSLEEKNKATQ